MPSNAVVTAGFCPLCGYKDEVFRFIVEDGVVTNKIRCPICLRRQEIAHNVPILIPDPEMIRALYELTITESP